MKRKSLLNNVIYNTYGTFFYFFCQWLITVLVVRITGYRDAGVLSLIISTSNLFYCISLFGVRNYQVSDVTCAYSDNEYIYTRIITTILSLICFFISMIFLSFDNETLLCCVVYILYKCAEAFSDVFFGLFQKYNDYNKIATSYTLKGVLTSLSFAIVLIITKSLMVTLSFNVVFYISILILYDIRNLKKRFRVKIKRFKCNKLLKECFPLMIYTCMVPYLNFITRLIIEKKYGTELLGYYSSVTMFFVVISTLMGSVFVSVIPKIATCYSNHNFKDLKKLLFTLLFLIICLAIVACLVANLFGDFVFSIIFGSEIIGYMYLLIPTILASITLTVLSLLSSILISFRNNKSVLFCNLTGALLCTLTISWFVEYFEMLGTLYCLIGSLSVSCVLLMICIKRGLAMADKSMS